MLIKHQKEVVGKPNVIVNDLGIEYGTYTHRPMNQFTMEELVDLSEKYIVGEDDCSDGLFQRLQQEDLDKDKKKKAFIQNMFLEIDSHRNHESIYSESLSPKKRKPCANLNGSIRII